VSSFRCTRRRGAVAAPHHRHQVVGHDGVELRGTEPGQHHDRHRDSGHAQRNRLLDVGDGEHRRALGHERARDVDGAMTVGVGLHHGHERHRNRHGDGPIVGRETREIDGGLGGPQLGQQVRSHHNDMIRASG
jgi:hypothetical protein